MEAVRTKTKGALSSNLGLTFLPIYAPKRLYALKPINVRLTIPKTSEMATSSVAALVQLVSGKIRTCGHATDELVDAATNAHG